MIRRPTIVAAMLLLAACAERPLSPAERAFTDTVLGPAIDADDVRFVRGSASSLIDTVIPVRPRTTCREKIYPPRSEPAPGSFPAMAIGPRVYFARDAWSADFLAGYPEAKDVRDAMRVAHELTHVWQWQRRDMTGYHPLKASLEHVESDDPYLLEIDPSKGFLDYAYEQQGVIIEEFVCCRTLDPEGRRTDELHRLVSEVFPAALRRDPAAGGAVRLPWDGATTEGICS
ncbi:hypothetical protein ACRDNQ_16195 [Palleronia sp. KMU-117]|uniref:hypothetical protein n=1 Tax=Palleronia sp. KMU-117 TaxID=3434108 RepID=UPI003D7354B4